MNNDDPQAKTVLRERLRMLGFDIPEPNPSYQYRKDIAKAIATYRASLRSSFKRYGEPIPLSRDCELAFNYAWLTCKFAIDKAGQQLDNARSHLGKGAHYGPYKN